MPTTTTEKKATKKSTTAKKEPAKKRVAKPKVEKAEAVVKEEKKPDTVAMQFAFDPSYPEDFQFFEMSIGDEDYCFPRGVVVEVPRKLYNIVMENERRKKASQAGYAVFKRPEGANLT